MEALLVGGVAFIVTFIATGVLVLRLSTSKGRLPWEKVNTTYLRGFKYGDVLTLRTLPLSHPVMVLRVRIEAPGSRLPVEHVVVLDLHPAARNYAIETETMASIWRKVDDA